MKIAIDLDGVAWKHSAPLSILVSGFKRMGYQVGILTAHMENESKEADLEKWHCLGFPEPDFYIGKQEKDRKTYIGKWKMEKIIEHKIDVLYDDFGGNNPDIEKTFMESGFKELSNKVLVLKVIGSER